MLTGTGQTFIDNIDGPSLGDLTKPWTADVVYVEGRRGVQRLVDLEIPIVAAVNGPVSVHSEYALLADVVIASETAVFSDVPHLAFGIAPGDGLVVVWEEVLGLNRARYLEITGGSFTAREALAWGAVGEVVPQENVLLSPRRNPGGANDRPTAVDQPVLGSQSSASALAAGSPRAWRLAWRSSLSAPRTWPTSARVDALWLAGTCIVRGDFSGEPVRGRHQQMDSEAESAVRRAIHAINDRTIRMRAAELLDPSIVRHDLVQLFPDSQGAEAGSDFVGMIAASMPDFRFDIEECSRPATESQCSFG